MQSPLSISRAVYRIVFRGGTPQRIHFSSALMLSATAIYLVCAVISQRLVFASGAIPIGLLLFTSLSGVYIAAALLTRKVARSKLALTLQAVMVLMAFSQVLMLTLIPFSSVEPMKMALTSMVAICLILGVGNCLQFALGCRTTTAMAYTVMFGVALAAFYAIMFSLLQTLFG